MSELTHLNANGEASMVDVAAQAVTERVAIAEGLVVMEFSTLLLIEEGDAPKGDVLAAARIAGIMAAKRTSDLIPLCHPLEALTAVSVSCLTLYDMLKARDKGMRIEGIRLLSKTGGKSGDFHASTPDRKRQP